MKKEADLSIITDKYLVLVETDKPETYQVKGFESLRKAIDYVFSNGLSKTAFVVKRLSDTEIIEA